MSAFKPPKSQRVHFTEYQRGVLTMLRNIQDLLDTLVGLESGIVEKSTFKAEYLAKRDAALMRQLEEEQIQESIDSAAKRNEELLRTEGGEDAARTEV